MATVNHNLSSKPDSIPNCKGKKVGIVVSKWNPSITSALLEGAQKALKDSQINEDDIEVLYVPGSFELCLGAQHLALRADIDGVISLGCVIQGETPHFDFICSAVAKGLTDVSLKLQKPVIFGVLTTLNDDQAKERAGGKHGNKGYEAGSTLTGLFAAGL
jgi:6,7-dimethyl-8-ribityllumazine synthase